MSSILNWLRSLIKLFFSKPETKHPVPPALVPEPPVPPTVDPKSAIVTAGGNTSSPSCTNTICLSVFNDKDQKAVVYQGENNTLDVKLQNSTGSNLPLKSGSNAQQLQLFLPEYFTDTEIGAANISLTNWKFTNATGILTLEYTGPDADWKQGDFNAIQFQITNVKATATPVTGTFQVNFINFAGSSNIPAQLTASLPLTKVPLPTNPKLSDVLEVSLDSAGTVYISSNAQDPLQNTLSLNIKNIGDNALFSGAGPWPVQPEVSISFIYGGTSGALAPDNDSSSPQIGSAWNIKSKVRIGGGNTWSTKNPNTSTQKHPIWTLLPTSTDLGIIGTGDNSNITFSISDLVSITPIGHTNMTIVFANFYKDINTPYDPFTIVLDINKIAPPATRGVIDFFSPEPNLVISSLTKPVVANFRWSLFQVHKIVLSNLERSGEIPPVSKVYSTDSPLEYDFTNIDLKGFDRSQNLTFNLKAFDGNNNLLNSKQFVVHLKSKFFVDDRDGQVYPTVEINSKTWLAANMRYDTEGGNLFYNKNQNNKATFGYLYTWDAARNNVPDGWHLPLKSEWEDFINFYGSAEKAYEALIEGGSSNFNAQLGGWGQPQNDGTVSFFDKGSSGIGYYWSNSPGNSESAFLTKFIAQSASEPSVKKEITVGNLFPSGSYLSCRYVKND